jgi:hypothetical protein
MKNLDRLQVVFQDFILNSDRAIDAEVVGTARVDAGTRLGIYANAYRLRLLEALDTDYPGLHTIAGDEEFERLGRAYIDAHPSTFRSLRWFGDRMSEFLRTTEPYRDYPVFAEMAAFEWGMSDAFDAADTSLATVENMAAFAADAWPALRFTPHDSLRRLDLRWNVPTVWKAIDAEQDPPELEESDTPIAWLVWRRDLRTYFRSLDVAEAWAVDAMTRGETFSTICEGLTEWIDTQNVPMHAAGLLKRWLTDGLIREIRQA